MARVNPNSIKRRQKTIYIKKNTLFKDTAKLQMKQRVGDAKRLKMNAMRERV